MVPYILDGDYMIIRRIKDPYNYDFKIGEIYEFRAENIEKYKGTDLYFVKRLTEIKDDGKLYFTGDCSEQSYDSRYFGSISRKYVTGKIIKVIHKRGYNQMTEKEKKKYRIRSKFDEKRVIY